MRIGLDLSPLSRERGGTSVHLRSLLGELARNDTADRLTLLGYLPSGPDPGVDGVTVRRGLTWWGDVSALWMQTEGARLARRDRLDLFWATLFQVPRALYRRVPVVATVHDVVWRLFPETMQRRTLWSLRLQAGTVIRRARRLVAASDCTARDLARFYGVEPARVRVVPPGVSSAFRPMDPEEARRDLHGAVPLPGGPYVLFLGNVEPRKNLVRLIRAHAACPQAPPLVIAGARGWRARPVFREAARHPGRVRLVGPVASRLLPALYSAAQVFVYPSLYEGFGLPVAEAMSCGCPVLASSAGALPEVAGDGALLVQPTDEDELAEGLRRLCEDGGLRSRLVEAGLARVRRFSWSAAAAAYREVFRETAEGR